MYYIDIKDLAANAIIEIMEKNGEQEGIFVTYKKLEEYGAEVVNVLYEKGEKAVLILSRNNTNALFRNYSDIFEEKIKEEGIGIALKPGISLNDMIDKFRGYLAWDVLIAFIDKKSIEKLGV